jgi:hypothetical protein
MSCLTTILKEHDEGLQAPVREVHQAASWLELLRAVWGVVCRVAVLVLEEQLTARAQRPVDWPACPRCGHRLQSKGWRSRRLRTLFGEIGWWRRVGRCPQGCRGSQVALLDDALGLRP